MWHTLLAALGKGLLVLASALALLLAGLAVPRLSLGLIALPLLAVLLVASAARLPSHRRLGRLLLAFLSVGALVGAGFASARGFHAECRQLLDDEIIGPNGLNQSYLFLWVALVAAVGATLAGGLAGALSRRPWFAALWFTASLWVTGLVSALFALLGHDLTYDMDRHAFVAVPTSVLVGGTLITLVLAGLAAAFGRHWPWEGRGTHPGEGEKP